jgi:nucleoside 2-deoxyribosyltransferase
MDIQFRLKDIHKFILLSIYSLGISNSTELALAVRLLSATEYDYLKLLKKVLDDRVYKGSLLFGFLSSRSKKLLDTPTGEEIIKGIEVLELLELLHKTPVYTTEKDAQGKEVKKLSSYKLSLAEEGKRVAERYAEGRRPLIRLPISARSSIFIASAVGHEDLDSLFENEFKLACEQIGYKPIRVDLSEPSQTITEAIIRGIQESECLIADLTYARPSVYFEAGLAHGLGIPLILTCRKDHFKGKKDDLRVHFDLEQYKISYWARAENGDFLWPKKMTPAERLQVLLNVKAKL